MPKLNAWCPVFRWVTQIRSMVPSAGFRNLPPADRAAVVSNIRRLGQLAADFPELAEIELNPVRVLPAGEGAFAVDVRARVEE